MSGDSLVIFVYRGFFGGVLGVGGTFFYALVGVFLSKGNLQSLAVSCWRVGG